MRNEEEPKLGGDSRAGHAEPLNFDEFLSRWFRRFRWLGLLLVLLAVTYVLVDEAQTSNWQSRTFSDWARQMDYGVGAGPSEQVRFPAPGAPYSDRLGYAALPDAVERLESRGFEVTGQAVISDAMIDADDLGLNLPYREKTSAGLTVFDREGDVLHASRYPERTWPNFESVPPVVVETLLWVENRALLDPERSQQNPAVEWPRLLNAVLELARYRWMDGPRPSGASTLATQLEKFRHSPGGRTRSTDDKLQQMLSASVRAYLDGPITFPAQRRIILDYLNTVPLAGKPGFGEVFGLGDGLEVWFEADLEDVSDLLRGMDESSVDPTETLRRARAYRMVLSLIIAQRGPSYFLREGQDELDDLVDAHLRLLAEAGVIHESTRDLALSIATPVKDARSAVEEVAFEQQKLSSTLRTYVAELVGAESLYSLDRWDAEVWTTIDADVQHAVEQALWALREPEQVRAWELDTPRLLGTGDPASVVYSFTLYERMADRSVLRVQADTWDQPFNINEGMMLDLGSTAKLRTLTTYLEAVAELHEQYACMTPEALEELEVDRSDTLTQWTLNWLRRAEDRSLEALLDAAMQRTFSATPHEAFFTGGGVHRFQNFSSRYNNQRLTVAEAFRGSVNLPFVRLMRELVRYHMVRMPEWDGGVLGDPKHPGRRAYLERFADYEGTMYLEQFWHKHDPYDYPAQVIRLLGSRRYSPDHLAAIYRSIRPRDDVWTFESFLADQGHGGLSSEEAQRLFDEYDPERLDLNDRAYISGIHPLELWVVGYLFKYPEASLEAAIIDSAEVRQEVYEWLFKTRRTGAQDLRIRVLMEQDAFAAIHERWKRLGYPFARIVPSYATALGASADRPDALARLVGIIQADGWLLPDERIYAIDFARGTPFETRLGRTMRAPVRVLDEVVARRLQVALRDVVENGTARRLARLDPALEAWEIRGKTGTGDNRYETFGPGARLVESQPRNRTATFVFTLGDRFFGTLSAYVDGPKSADYQFTSALPVTVLAHLVPLLSPLLDATVVPERGGVSTVRAGVVRSGMDVWTSREPPRGTVPAAFTLMFP